MTYDASSLIILTLFLIALAAALVIWYVWDRNHTCVRVTMFCPSSGFTVMTRDKKQFQISFCVDANALCRLDTETRIQLINEICHRSLQETILYYNWDEIIPKKKEIEKKAVRLARKYSTKETFVISIEID